MSPSALAATFCLVAGVAVAVQAAVNGELGQRIGVTETALLSGIVTTVMFAAALVALRGGTGGLERLTSTPAWLWIGGVMGTIAVAAISFSPPRIGVFATVALLLVGQLAMGLVIDALGLLGQERTGVALSRIAGLVLLAVGALLVLRR